MANVWSLIPPLLGEIEICIQRVFCKKFNFGQLLLEAFFDTIGTFGRNQVKFKNFKNPYFGSKPVYFRENLYANPYMLKKFIPEWIYPYIWQH